MELVAAGARGDDQAVSQLCSRLLHLDHRNLQATVATAKLYRKCQMLPEALHWCRIARSSFPQATLFAQMCAELEPLYGAKADALGLVAVAETSLQQKEYAAAARYAAAAVRKDPGSSRALLVLALGEEGTEHLDEARKRLEQLAEMEDSNVVAASLKRVKRKQQAATRKAFGHLLTQAEKDRVAGRPDAALAGLTSAAECFAEDPLLYALTAICLGDLQRYPEAIATAIGGLEIDHVHKRCRAALTQVRRDYDADLERQITAQLAAMAASCKERILQAAEATGVAVASLLADRRNNLNALRLLTNEQPGVDPVLTQELQFWLLSGTQAELSQQYPAALDWYGRVLAVLPGSALARKRAAATRTKQAQCVKHHISVVKESRLSGDADAAFAAASAAVAADPRSVLALVQLARLFEARKEFGQALELYERANEVLPADATLQQRIEGCRERRSKHKRAQVQKVGETVAQVAIRAAMGRMF